MTKTQRQAHSPAGTGNGDVNPVRVAQPPGLVAHRIAPGGQTRIVPAPVERSWLDATDDRFGYRCLPVLIANQAGWFVLNGHSLDAIWNGGDDPESLRLTYRSAEPPYPAVSHFGHGVLTWHIPFVFQTPPGVQLLVRGPANWPKDGVYPLEGVVETEWAAATFTMNWKMLRPRHRVSFEPGEPICMIVPCSLDLLETARPEIRNLSHDPALHEQHHGWSASRAAFSAARRDPSSPAAAQGWQKDYFLGRAPAGRGGQNHRTRLRLSPFFDIDGTSEPDDIRITEIRDE